MRKLRPLLDVVVAVVAALGMAGTAACAELPPRIVMMWQVTGKNYEADFRELKALGVNTVQSFALAGEDPAYVDGYLKAADAAGLGVVAALRNFIEGEGQACQLSSAGVEFVRSHAAAPALLAWHTVDEPVNHNVARECQRSLYEQVKKLDPAHLVMVSINNTKQQEYDEYFAEDAFDILDLHRYPNPDIGPAQERLLSTFKQNRHRKYRVIVTLRAFEAPSKVRRLNMRQGTLLQQYSFFFGPDRVGEDIGFYGWRLAPNLGISQIDWLKAEFGSFTQEKLDAPRK